MFKKIRLLTILVGIQIVYTNTAYADSELYSEISMDSYSESYPVNDVIRGLDNDYSSGNTIYVFAREIAGIKIAQNYLAMIRRYDATAKYSKNTGELIFYNETDRETPKNSHYSIDLAINQSTSSGFLVGHIFNAENGLMDGLSIDTSIQMLEVNKYTDGQITGFIDSFNTDYEGALHVDYVYTKDQLFERPGKSKNGNGYTVDLKASWEIDDANTVRIKLLDIVSSIQWKAMFYTTADLTTARINFDSAGKLDVRPALSGFEGEKNYTQRLTASYTATWQYSFGYGDAIETEYYQVFTEQELRWRYLPEVLEGWYFYASTKKALGFGVNTEYFTFFIASDDMNTHDANSFNLLLKANVNF